MLLPLVPLVVVTYLTHAGARWQGRDGRGRDMKNAERERERGGQVSLNRGRHVFMDEAQDRPRRLIATGVQKGWPYLSLLFSPVFFFFSLFFLALFHSPGGRCVSVARRSCPTSRRGRS